MAFVMHEKDKERFLASLAKWAHLLEIATSGPAERAMRLTERVMFNAVERTITQASKKLAQQEGWSEPRKPAQKKS